MYQLLESTWHPSRLPAIESIPWNEIIDCLISNNLGALAYSLIREDHQRLPHEIQLALSHEFYLTIANNTQCLGQLSQLKDAFNRRGIPFILLKGVALATELYHPPSIRHYGDIDLLVDRSSVPICREILTRLGHRPAHIEHQPGSILQHNNEIMFLPPAPFLTAVELHWHLLDIPYYLRHLPMDWFWENTVTLEIEGEKYKVLNPVANMVYLPAHLALHHRYQALHPLLDLALLIIHHQETTDWNKVIHAAQQFELLFALRETLNRLAQHWSSLPILEPLQYLDRVQPSTNDSRLFHLLTAETRTTTLDFYTTFVSLPGFLPRLRYAWVNLFPQPAYMNRRYGVIRNWHLPYWYLHRLITGFFRIARMLPDAIKTDRYSRNLKMKKKDF